MNTLHRLMNISIRNSSRLCTGAPRRNYMATSLISSGKYRKSNEHSSNLKRYPIALALLGFSLKDYIGNEDQEKEKEKDSEIVLLIKKGSVAFYNKEYEKAERLLHVALKYAQDTSDPKAVTYIYDIMANLAYQQQDFVKAEKIFKAVLQRYAAEEDSDLYSNEFIAVSLKIANCFAAQKQFTNSIKGFHYCIGSLAHSLQMVPPSSHTPDAIPSKIDTSDSDRIVLYAMALEQYAGLVASVGQYSTSVLFLKEALRICLTVNGEKHLQTAVLKNQMGAILAREEKYEEAATEIQSAIDIAKQHLEAEAAKTDEAAPGFWSYFMGSSSPRQKVGPVPQETEENALSNLATFHINLGSVYLLKGDMRGGKECCTLGEAVARRAKDAVAMEEAAKCLKTANETLQKNKNKE